MASMDIVDKSKCHLEVILGEEKAVCEKHEFIMSLNIGLLNLKQIFK